MVDVRVGLLGVWRIPIVGRWQPMLFPSVVGFRHEDSDLCDRPENRDMGVFFNILIVTRQV